MTITSILVQRVVDKQLRAAKQQIERDGFLQPLLYVHIVGDNTLEMPLSVLDSDAEKARHFFAIGRHLRERGLQPSEAVLVSESWIVDVQQAPAAVDFRPSEHPSRQEAIVLIGRNADGSRFTQMVQPFIWDTNNRPVWQAPLAADYFHAQLPGPGCVGLLDYFFEPLPASL